MAEKDTRRDVLLGNITPQVATFLPSSPEPLRAPGEKAESYHLQGGGEGASEGWVTNHLSCMSEADPAINGFC